MLPLMRLSACKNTSIAQAEEECSEEKRCFIIQSEERNALFHSSAVTHLTLSSFASISTTSVSTSSMFALKNTKRHEVTALQNWNASLSSTTIIITFKWGKGFRKNAVHCSRTVSTDLYSKWHGALRQQFWLTHLILLLYSLSCNNA